MFKFRLLPLCTSCLRRINPYSVCPKKTLSSRSDTTEELNRPIKYTSSPASKYRAKTTRTGVQEERLWYEPYVIVGSISVFLFYFCVFREENDIDKELHTSLYSRIDGLEEHQLRLSLKYNEDVGKESGQIIQRLEEIEQEKQKKI